jgi:TolB-like protein/DNA-binding winged helix-turn-helix (wHTH) protein/Flp pilus assembly protein TadD
VVFAHHPTFKIGDWEVEPDLDRVSHDDRSEAIRPQVMELLVYLAKRSGEVVSTDDLLRDLWAGKVVTPSSVYNCISELRQVFGVDQDGRPVIETIPKRGYRLIAPVSGFERPGQRLSPKATIGRRQYLWRALALAGSVAALTTLVIGSLFMIPDDPDGFRGTPIAGGREPSIAVLPFDDLSPQGNQSYFCKGIAEELLNTLSTLRGMRVTSRSSSFAVHEAELTAPEIAHTLGVDYLLEGSVRKVDGLVRITAQLIQARTDSHLWSQTWERSLDDIFAVQEEISVQIARALNVRMSTKPTEIDGFSAAAHDFYLQGLALLANRGADLARAAELFNQAIAIEPGFAAAYGSLALTYIWSDRHGRVEAIVQRTLELDPQNSDAWTALGFLRDSQAQFRSAREAFELSIRYNPNNATAHRWLGRSFANADPVRYLEFAHRAYLIDPLDPTIHYHLAQALSSMGRYDEALDAAWHLVAQKEEPLGFSIAGLIHHKKYEIGSAVANYLRAYQLAPNHGAQIRDLPQVLMELGLNDLADEWIEVMPNTNIPASAAMLQKIVLDNSIGERDRALRSIAEGVNNGLLTGADLGWAHLLVGRDYRAAREALKNYLTEPGQDEENFDADRWPVFLDYALALQLTGSPDRASELIEEILALLEDQVAAGVVSVPFGYLPHRLYLGALHAMANNPSRAMLELEEAALADTMLCVTCLRTWPHFQSLRGQPRFESLIASQEEKAARELELLIDQGLLLSPQEVRRMSIQR